MCLPVYIGFFFGNFNNSSYRRISVTRVFQSTAA